MTPENKLRVQAAQADAWRDCTSLFSLVDRNPEGSDARRSWVAVLIQKANEHKRKIDRLIDSIPED